MAGMALGVMALITVLSVMNGFEKELRERILGVVSHSTVQGLGGGITDWLALRERLLDYPDVIAAAPYIQAEGLLNHGGAVHGVMVRAVLPELEVTVSELAEQMLVGSLASLRPGEFNIALGSELALSLGAMVGDTVTLITPQAFVTPVGMLPRLKRFNVSAVFEVGMYEYDSSMALMHIDDAKKLFRTDGEVTGVRLQLDDMFAVQTLTQQLQHDLPRGFQVIDWTMQHANFFRAVRMEKAVMFVILLLIVAVAAFNLVSSLVMMVTDKESDIAILRTLGMSPREVMAVFIVQGTIVGVTGTLLGGVGGVLLAQNIDTIIPALENLIGFKFLAPEVYYISDLPSDLRYADVFQIISVALVLCLTATLYPAWRAAQTQPVEALRYE